ncbi:MAG: RluA family pseudouridine synthase [Saprospiraceae bacterium]
MPIRLQEYGVGIFIQTPTKSALKKALKKGYVRVNGAIASTATYIKGGETIQLEIPEGEIKEKKIFNLKLKVIYEDQYLAAIHKPAGLLVSGNGFKSINNALLQNLIPSQEADATLPHSVHRLDFPTTGILLTGKTASCIRELNSMFENKEIKKTYLAIVIGAIRDSGQISDAIDGKVAVSTYQKLASAPSPRCGQLHLLRLEPKTGRRHQLRKHLAEIGNPILGDKDYGKEGLILNGKGLYLHAYSLSFLHPKTGIELILKDDIPTKFQKIFPEAVAKLKSES